MNGNVSVFVFVLCHPCFVLLSRYEGWFSLWGVVCIRSIILYACILPRCTLVLYPAVHLYTMMFISTFISFVYVRLKGGSLKSFYEETAIAVVCDIHDNHILVCAFNYLLCYL